jgi:hypothetical protein
MQSPPAPGERRPINPFLARDPSLRAKRLARALVSDMVAYYPAKHSEGLQKGTLKELFREGDQEELRGVCCTGGRGLRAHYDTFSGSAERSARRRQANLLERKAWQTLLESVAERWHRAPSDSRKCGGIFDIEGKREALSSLDLRMADPSFWNNQEEAQKTLSEVKSLRMWVDPYDKLEEKMTTAKELHELLSESSDPDMEKELDEMIESLDVEIDSFEVKTLMRGEADFRDAQVEISAGAGGTEPGLGADASAHVHALG